MKKPKGSQHEQERLRALQIKAAWEAFMDPMAIFVKCFPEYGQSKIPTSETFELLERALILIHRASQTLRDRPRLRVV
jgi:hypothetical protein